MTTDPQRYRRTDRGDPELSPVFQLHRIFSTEDQINEVAEGCRTAGIGCLDCKKVLLENLFKVLNPIWSKRNDILKKPGIIEEIVQQGSDKARKVSEETMCRVRDAIGFIGR
jgi:tryptophanyl-tRNA synthetase